MQPWLTGERDALAEPFRLTNLAGLLAFADAGGVDGNPADTALARRGADLILPTGTNEVVRFATGWTDDMYMATSLLARVASQTGDPRYTRAIGRLLPEYARILQRPDGLFVHGPESPFAWGRGNGFAALGLAEALAYLPETWPERETVLGIFRRQMEALIGHQSADGSWREVVDEPESYQELTVTAMVVAAMARGIRLGWLPRAEYGMVVEAGWRAVVARVGEDGSVRNVCTSTEAGPTKEYYMERPVVNGMDDRGGAMVLLAAVEMEELRRNP
jgi:rhamnogalacturonyl hydrolase YesR